VNFLRRVALQDKKKLNDSSRLDVVEIASLTCFRACFLPRRAKDLSALYEYRTLLESATRIFLLVQDILLLNADCHV